MAALSGNAPMSGLSLLWGQAGQRCKSQTAMNSFATLADKVTERRNARSVHTGEGRHYGIIFNLALGNTDHGHRHGREPDFGGYPRRQERRCPPCHRIGVCTGVWVDLFLCGKTGAKMRFSVHGAFRTSRDVRLDADMRIEAEVRQPL
jgi:hypothetical protein